jgi:hypothetical protein
VNWGNNPDTILALATLGTGVVLFLTAVFVWLQLRGSRHAREAAVLISLLELFSMTFLPQQTYKRLQSKARALAASGQVQDWSAPLDEDEVQLLRIIKLYSVAGSMLEEGMVRPGPLLQFVSTPLRHHYRDLKPFFASATSRVGVEQLLALCDKYFPLSSFEPSQFTSGGAVSGTDAPPHRR